MKNLINKKFHRSIFVQTSFLLIFVFLVFLSSSYAEKLPEAILGEADNHVQVASELMRQAQSVLRQGRKVESMKLAISLFAKAGGKFEDAMIIYRSMGSQEYAQRAAAACESAAHNCLTAIEDLKGHILGTTSPAKVSPSGQGRFPREDSQATLVQDVPDIDEDIIYFKDGSYLSGDVKSDEKGFWVNGTFIPIEVVDHVQRRGTRIAPKSVEPPRLESEKLSQELSGDEENIAARIYHALFLS